MAFRAYLFLGMIEAAAAMAAYFFVLLGAGWHFGQSLEPTDPLYLRATTACLSAIIVMQIVNVFLCRSSVRSIFTINLTDNRLIIWGVALEVAHRSKTLNFGLFSRLQECRAWPLQQTH